MIRGYLYSFFDGWHAASLAGKAARVVAFVGVNAFFAFLAVLIIGALFVAPFMV